MTTQNAQGSDIQVFEFVMELPEQERAKYLDKEGDFLSAEAHAAAIEAYHASLGEDTGQKGPRKEREAREYTIAILSKVDDGSAVLTVVGKGFGSVGRESNDPTKWSAARTLRSKAERKAHMMRKQGENVLVITLPTEEYLGTFFG